MSNSPISAKTLGIWAFSGAVILASAVALAFLITPLSQLYRSTVTNLSDAHYSHRASAELEQGSYAAAISDAKSAHSATLLGVAYALTNQQAALRDLAASQGSPEASGRILQLGASNLALAQELYALGLYKRSLTEVKLAVAQDPARITAQRLLVTVARKTGDSALADQHQALLDRLTAGRP